MSNGGKQSFTEIKVKPTMEPTGNMQGENDNHASNNQEKDEDYQEAEVQVQEMDDEESPKNEFANLEDEF